MVKNHRKIFVRISCFVAALFVVAASFLVVPADAYTVGTGPESRRYSDFQFYISFTNQYTISSGSPADYSYTNFPTVTYADSFNFDGQGLTYENDMGAFMLMEQFSLRADGFRYRLRPASGSMSNIVFTLGSPIFVSSSRPQIFGLTGGSSSGAIKYTAVIEGYVLEKSATNTLYSQNMVHHVQTITGSPTANNYFYIDLQQLDYDFSVITAITISLEPQEGAILQLYIHSTAMDTTPVPSDGYRSFFDDLDLDLEIHHTVIEEVVSEFPTDWTGWLLAGVAGFLEFEIAPGFTLGGIFAAIFGIIVTVFLIRLFGK